MQQPSVGRVVHYVGHGTPVRADGSQAFSAQCRAAIITEVGDPAGIDADQWLVGLCVLNPTGQFFHPLAAGGCRFDDLDDHAGGTWHWPERV